MKEIPLEEARKFFDTHGPFYRQIELGARRRTAEWEYTLDEPNPIGLLLPDVNWMRNYEPMLVLKARMAVADGDFAAACHHLETGFAFSRHVGEGPTLIHSLVAIAMASQFADTVGDFIEQPDSPNLYWALTALPQPLVDLQAGLAFEYQTIDKQFPGLVDLDRERTAEQWDGILRHLRTELRQCRSGREGQTGTPRVVSQRLRPGRSGHKVTRPCDGSRIRGTDERPGCRQSREDAGGSGVVDLHRGHKLTRTATTGIRRPTCRIAQARPVLEAAAKRLREAPISEGHLPARMLLPALDRVLARQNLLERNIAALRVIEALRIYAAAHDGQLPDKLSDVTEVPVPDDPGTGKPFEYRLDADTAHNHQPTAR